MNDHDIQTAYRTMERALTPTPEASTAVHQAVASRQRTRSVFVGLGTLAVAAGVTSAAIGVSGALEPGPERDAAVATQETASPTSSSSLANQLEWQGSVRAYENALTEAALRYPNYSGTELAFDGREIIVYGSGEPSAEVSRLLSQAPGVATARWISVPYSKSELEEAGDQLSTAIPNAVITRYVDNYSRILIGVDGLPSSEAELQELHLIAKNVTSIPVRFEEQQPILPAPLPPPSRG